MPRLHITRFRNPPAGLKGCFALTRQDLGAWPVCPHSIFRFGSEGPATSGAADLVHLAAERKRLLENWARRPLTILEASAARVRLDQISPGPGHRMDAFPVEPELSEELDESFIHTAQEVSSQVLGKKRTEDLPLGLLGGLLAQAAGGGGEALRGAFE